MTAIGERAFEDNQQLTGIVIPDGVGSLGEFAFSGCSALTTATIGNGVETIQRGVFNACDALEKVFIGENVTTISEDAFANNANLITEIHCRAQNPPLLHEDAFQYPEYEVATLYVPNAESVMAYQEADVWKNFEKIEVDDGSTGVDDIAGDVDDIVTDEYYNLQGMKVERPEPGCVYIVKRAGKTIKALVK